MRGEEALFCCAGCASAHEIIGGAGLDSFYRRLEDKRAHRPVPLDIDFTDHARTAANGETELDPDLGTGDTGRYLQPEVTTPFLLTFEVPVGAEVADEVTLIMLRESYGWSNLVNFGPTWSGGVPFRSVTVPVAR